MSIRTELAKPVNDVLRPFDCGVWGADLGFYRAEASAGRLRSWLRRLRSVEAERDGLAEQLEDAALFGGRRCQFFEAFPGEADGVSGEGGQMGDQFVVAADGQLVRGDFRGVFRGRGGGSAGRDYRVFAGGLLLSVKVSGASAWRRCQVR